MVNSVDVARIDLGSLPAFLLKKVIELFFLEDNPFEEPEESF